MKRNSQIWARGNLKGTKPIATEKQRDWNNGTYVDAPVESPHGKVRIIMRDGKKVKET